MARRGRRNSSSGSDRSSHGRNRDGSRDGENRGNRGNRNKNNNNDYNNRRNNNDDNNNNNNNAYHNGKKWNTKRLPLAECVIEYLINGSINPKELRSLVVVTALLLNHYWAKHQKGKSEAEMIEELWLPASACYVLHTIGGKAMAAAIREDPDGDLAMLDIDDFVYNGPNFNFPNPNCSQGTNKPNWGGGLLNLDRLNTDDIELYLGRVFGARFKEILMGV
ncbi:hypothetical protein MMYC01_201456 [Madurella mycetomatis]|uniref:Uncharacterized protein n=1 Tax=Madurella mycetomatis TaxID=100816 RepID=A0A175WCV0_9PEZI|nr:hypothetical protein MMYC01_201456 [Madurella mycetomatis]